MIIHNLPARSNARPRLERLDGSCSQSPKYSPRARRASQSGIWLASLRSPCRSRLYKSTFCPQDPGRSAKHIALPPRTLWQIRGASIEQRHSANGEAREHCRPSMNPCRSRGLGWLLAHPCARIRFVAGQFEAWRQQISGAAGPLTRDESN